MNDSRAILLTPPGAAAIAVVRIAGPRVAGFLAERFSRPARAGRCVHAQLRDADGRVLDDPVVLLHEHAQVADINLHGGPWVVASVIDLLGREGFEIVGHREGPTAAVAVDASEAIWHDVLAHLPLARTEQALRLLLAQPAAWARGGRPDPEDRSLWWLLHPPRVAIVGLPNVGKSTLANQLFAQERSITADLPGTTRDWVGEMANVDGLVIELVDTPGVRETADEIERVAIERSGAEVGRADLVLVVMDASKPLSGEAQRLTEAHPDSIVVWNKADVSRGEIPGDATHTVATTGEGVDRLRAAIRRRFGCDSFDESRPRWWTLDQRNRAMS